MDKAIVATAGTTVTLEADQRARRMKLTLQYKGTKQVDELNTVNDIAAKIWINSRLHEFYDFHFHTTGHRDPLNLKPYKKQLRNVLNEVQRAVFEDFDLAMILELSEVLADFLDEEDALEEKERQNALHGKHANKEEDAHGIY